MDFNFSASSLLAGFVFGVFGAFLVKRGRQKGNIPNFAIGIVLIGYPYFIANDVLLWGLGVALLLAAYLTRKA